MHLNIQLFPYIVAGFHNNSLLSLFLIVFLHIQCFGESKFHYYLFDFELKMMTLFFYNFFVFPSNLGLHGKGYTKQQCKCFYIPLLIKFYQHVKYIENHLSNNIFLSNLENPK